MDKKKIYSVIMFLFVSIVVINSVVLIGVNSKNNGNSIKSILKNINIDKYIDVSTDEKPQNDDNVDPDFSYDENEDEEKIRTTVVQSARGGIVMEQSTRRVLLDENMNVRCFPASTTKVLTALVVLNTLPLDTIVTVPKEAEGVEGSSIYLRAGQKISVEDLLTGMMLRSGNDAATALAIETSGSVPEFAILMNETASALGAKSSNFVNPHGLHDEAHFTTAFDLALITAAAYDNPDFVRIASLRKAKITIDGEPSYIGNKNKLLTFYEGANGVKTGYTKRSGRCLVGGAERNGMQLISVVLNYNDMWNDTMRMLDYGFDNYDMTPLDESLLQYREGKRPVEILSPVPSTGDWKDIRYPLRKDGSEYIVPKAA